LIATRWIIIARADPARHPQLYALRVQLAELDEQVWLDEYWVRPSVQEMVRGTIRSWSERVELAVEDILALPADGPLIVEGPGFFPEAIQPLLSAPRQAIFLVPSEAFKRASHERREKSGGRRASRGLRPTPPGQRGTRPSSPPPRPVLPDAPTPQSS